MSVNAPHLHEWLPLIGIPMDIELEPTLASSELDEEFRKGRLEDVVTEFLTLVLPTSTVLVLEDAHLMDDASADLLGRLAARINDNPWLLLVTRRDQEAGFVPEPDPSVVTVVPPPLAPEAALELVHAALEAHPLTPQALDTLAARSGGNPMFLEALVREAALSGSVADLPESVEALVTSQIDRLDPADRTVLRYAAVLGMVVDEEELGGLLHDHDEHWSQHDGLPLSPSSARSLRRLDGFFVHEQGKLRFRHTLMRDVAYEGLPFSRRRLLHEQVGRAIEASAATPESQCELLSMHFFHAGRHESAWRYSVLAGERAIAKYANAEAIDFFERAVQAARSHRAVEPGEIARVLEKLADSRFLVGLSEAAAGAYAQARREVRGDPVRTAGIIEKEARVDQRLGGSARRCADLRRSARPRRGDRQAGDIARSLLARRYAFCRFSQGRIDDALQWGHVAARAAEDSVDKEALAWAYEILQPHLRRLRPRRAAALRATGPAGLHRARRHHCAGARPQQPGRPGRRCRPVERGPGHAIDAPPSSSAASATRRARAMHCSTRQSC